MTADEVYEKVLSHFTVQQRKNDSAQCICPCHNDKQASLTISKGRKCVLMRDHAGCSNNDIVSAVNLKMQDLFYDYEPKQSYKKEYTKEEKKQYWLEHNYIDIYHYYNIDTGQYTYTKYRMPDKQFLQGFYKNKIWHSGLENISPEDKELSVFCSGTVKELKEQAEQGGLLVYCEGEKDCKTVSKFNYISFTLGSATGWESKKTVLSYLKKAQIICFGDNEPEGIKSINELANYINSIGGCAVAIIPPDVKEHGDISDYMQNHNEDDLKKLISQALEQMTVKKQSPAALDKSQFHHYNKQSEVTGVFHNAIFEYIKANYNLFVCGGTPYIYDGGFYKADYSGARLKSIIRSFIYPQFIKSQTINNIYNLFLQDITLERSFEQLNQYPAHWICFQNGMWDCKEQKLISHSQNYYCINQIPHSYNGEIKQGVKIEEYLKFICEQADDREMLLQYIGYCLTRDTSQQRFLVLSGCGGSGKSTLIKLIESLVGKQNISNVALGELSQRFASFGLLGKLVNSCADLEIGALEDTSIIKKLLGEDVVRGEQKGRDSVFFNSYAKLVFSTNELPLVKSEKSNGFYRRLLILTMDKIPLQKNPHLFQELESEIDYLLYISVQALERLYKQELITVSESSDKAVNQLWHDSDTVQAFITDCCILDDGEKSERVFLYNKYKNYCEETERVSLTKNNFYKSLRIKGCKDFKTNGERYFKGISYNINSPKGQIETALNGFLNVTDEEIAGLDFS